MAAKLKTNLPPSPPSNQPPKNDVEELNNQGVPLCIGNVILLKYNTEFDKNGKFKQVNGYFSGYLGGDGLAVNSLYCFMKEQSQKNTLSRLLFEIIPHQHRSKKKSKSKVQKSEPQLGANHELIKTSEREISNKAKDKFQAMSKTAKLLYSDMDKKKKVVSLAEDSEKKKISVVKKKFQKKIASKGDPVLYGMKISLKHLYSESYISVNKFKLSKEKDSVNVSLRGKNDSNSVVMFSDPSNTKKFGEIVLTNDTVSICFAHSDYVLKVNETHQSRFKLRINAGKSLCMFSIMSFETKSGIFSGFRNKLKNGDIIKLYNKDTEKYLGVNYDPSNFLKVQK